MRLGLPASTEIEYVDNNSPGSPPVVFSANGYDAIGVSAGSASGIWRAAGASPYPYVVEGDISLYKTLLTIDPGLVVKMAPGVKIFVDARDATTTLTAVGAPADSIVFTSLKDDDYAGDTNGDVWATTAAPGDWYGLEFRGGTGDGSLLQYCVIRYAGSGEASIYCHPYGSGTAHPTIRESRIEYGAGPGVRSDTSGPRLYDSTIRNNASYAVYIVGGTDIQYRSVSEPSLPENVFENNGYDAVGIASANVFGEWQTVGTPPYPYVVEGDISLYKTLLTIDPGLVVKMAPGVKIFVDARDATTTLTAVGAPADSIVFTSLKDDDYAGDTNGDVSATTAAPGDWYGLEFRGGTGDGSLLQYCVIRYAGSGEASIYCHPYGSGTAHPTIRESRIEYGAGPGVRSDTSGPRLYDSTIRNNASYAVYIVGGTDIQYRSVSEPSLPENVFENNGYDAVGIASANVFGEWQTVGTPPYPYVVEGDISLYKTLLTIDPGLVVKMASGVKIFVDARDATTTLTAVGAPADSIVFTSLKDDDYAGDTNGDVSATTAAPGDWYGLEFRGGTGDASLLQYCVIRYAGSGEASIYCHPYGSGTAHPTIRESRIEYGAGPGVRSDTSGPRLYDSTIRNNASYAVYIVGGTDIQYRSVSEPSLPENVFENNGYDAIAVATGSVSGTWGRSPSSSYPYLILGSVTLNNGASLTIDGPNVLKMNPNVEILAKGDLQIAGSCDSPITLTSVLDDNALGDTNGDSNQTVPGPLDWGRVHFQGTGAITSSVTGAIFRYGGGPVADQKGQVWCENTGSTASPNVNIESNQFVVASPLGGVYCSGSNPTVFSCDFSGASAMNGVFNATNTITIDATGNWWGDATGPSDPSPGAPDQNTSGTGVGVSDYVAYRPWLPGPGTCPPHIEVEPNGIESTVASTAAGQLYFAIWNQGAGSLSFAITEGLGPGDASKPEAPLADLPWLSVSPAAGFIAPHRFQEIVIDFDVSTLSPGLHAAYLVISSDDPERSPVVFPLELTVSPTTGLPEPQQPDRPLFASPSPNPFSARTAFALNLKETQRVLLQVFDSQGRIVRVLTDGEMSPGAHSIDWNGLDESGRRLSAGVYYVRLRVPDKTIVKRVVYIR